jgi:hypothetical protein
LEGWVLFIVALVLLVAFHQLINRIYGSIHRSHPGAPAQHVTA